MSSKKSHQQVTIKSETSEWTKEQTNNLLNRMLTNLSKTDTQKYTSMLDKLHWEKVAFDGFTVEQCKERWHLVAREVRKYRTLTELVVDAKEYLRDPYKGQIKKHPDYPKRPLTPYFRFFMEKRDAYASKHKDMNNLQVTAELSKKYRALSPKKKEKYVDEWKNETSHFQIAMKKFKEEHPEYFTSRPSKPADPRTPGAIYRDETYDEYARKHPKLSKKECFENLRKHYNSLSDEKRQKYIEKALKEQQEHKDAINKFVVSNPDTVKKERVILNKYEQKLIDKKMGKPEKPPSNGYNLFCTEMMPQLKNMLSQKRIVECGRLWNLKTAVEKQAYHDRYMKLKEQYEEDFEKYNQKLPPENREKEHTTGKQRKKSGKVKPAENGSSDDEGSEEGDLPVADSSEDDEEEESEDDDDNDDDDDKETDVEDEEDLDVKDENLPTLPAPARPTTPISALFLYQKANRKKIEGQYPTMSPDEITRLLARRYHELPEHKKHKYLQKEKEQRAIYNEKMQEYLKKNSKKNGVETPKPTQLEPVTGEQLYHEKLYPQYMKKFQNNKEKAEAALRVAWCKLSKVKKEPFIKSAHQHNEKNIAAYNEAMQKHKAENAITAPNKKKSTSTNKNVTTSGAKALLKGEPKKPPSSGYQLFSATHMSKLSHLLQNEKFREIGRLWQNLDAARKKSFNDEAKKQTDKYKKELENWLKSLPSAVADQYRESHKPKKRGKKAAAPSSPANKKAKITQESLKESDSSEGESDSSSSGESDDAESDSDSSEDDSDSEEDSSENSSSDDEDDDDDSSSSNSE